MLRNDDSRYDFVSVGPSGLIDKQIRFALLHDSGVYNLAFGDFNPVIQLLDDQAVSNNGDVELILATVAAAVRDFCHHHPGASIFAVGGTPARTRLYRMAITHHLDQLQTQFTIYGEFGDAWEPFQPTASTPLSSPNPTTLPTTYENCPQTRHHRSTHNHS